MTSIISNKLHFASWRFKEVASKEQQEMAQQINAATNEYASQLQVLVDKSHKQEGWSSADQDQIRQIINNLRLIGQDPSNPVPNVPQHGGPRMK